MKSKMTGKSMIFTERFLNCGKWNKKDEMIGLQKLQSQHGLMAIWVALFAAIIHVNASSEERWWDGGATNISENGNGLSAGGNGSWGSSLTNWDQGAGIFHRAWENNQNDFAVFGGSAGTVTLLSAISVNRLTFNTNGYLITGTPPNILTLSGQAPRLSAKFGASATIDSIVAGTGGFLKTGPGSVILRNVNNSISGGVTVDAGELQGFYNGTNADTYSTLGTGPVTVNSGAVVRFKCGSTFNNITYTNSINLNGATLIHDDGNHMLSGPFLITGNNTISSVWANKNLTLSGVIEGTGSLRKTGQSTTLRLTGSNSYTGGTILEEGNLSLSEASALGAGPLRITKTRGDSLATGTVIVANDNTITIANDIMLPTPESSQTYNLVKKSSGATSGNQLNLTGAIAGGNAKFTLLFNSDIGGDTTTSYRLAGNNTFIGNIHVYAGSLVITNAASLGAPSNTLELNSNYSNLGDLRFENSLTLSNPITLVWPATISTEGNNIWLAGQINGASSLNKISTGILTLTAGNSYSGATSVSSGTLSIGDGGTSGTLGTGPVVNNSILMFNRLDTVQVANSVSGTGEIIQTGTGTTILTGINTYSGNTTVAVGGMRLAGHAQIRFKISANGENNRVMGNGYIDIAGDIMLDLTSASAISGNSWTLFDIASKSFEPSCSVISSLGIFSRIGNYHMLVSGSDVWSFSECTGILTVGVGSYGLWALQITNTNERDREDDPDNDGISNIQEFLFGSSPLAGSGDQVAAEVSGGMLALRWLQRESGVSYVLKTNTSSLLNTWENSNVVQVPDPDQSGVPSGYGRYKAVITINSPRAIFRVEGTENFQ